MTDYILHFEDDNFDTKKEVILDAIQYLLYELL